jgi:predicted ATPase
MHHLQAFMGRQDSVARGDNISQALNLRWKLLLSNLVSAISSQDHPIALMFEDLHWANEDTLGEMIITT